MRLTELTGRPVLDLATATTIGKVADFVIDPAARLVVGFQLDGVKGPRHWLSWDAMNSLGPDALTIDRDDVLGEPPQHARGLRATKVLGGRVLTDSGRDLGNLVDLDVDPETGHLTALEIAGTTMPADALIGVGSYATVVVDPHS
jgi:sporulation protein YlmC with PRC-barrel domain